MKVLIILAVCAAALAADKAKLPVPVPSIFPTTVAPVTNSTEVPVVNGTTVVPPPAAAPAVRQGRYLALVNGYYYDRVYDVTLTRDQYYYVVKNPVYTVNRDIEIVY